MVLMLWVILHLPLHVILSVLDPPGYLDPALFFVGAFVQWFLIGWAGYRIRKKCDRTVRFVELSLDDLDRGADEST
jgi:hypothetical protein